MPWRSIRPMDSKIQFVSLAIEGQIHMTELCAHFNISRKTGYKWLNRYMHHGPDGLKNRSTAPKHIAHKTSDHATAFIIDYRKKYPSWGARKIAHKAALVAPELSMPSETTINNILQHHGLISKKRRPRKPGHQRRSLRAPKRPNHIWTTDFKGQFKTKDGRYCYPLTILDEYSRYLIDCKAMLAISLPEVSRAFKKAFLRYGLPDAIKSDNGSPFATTALARISKMSVWWIKLGIDPILIQPASPQQNGIHERMHKTLKNESTIPPSTNLKTQQQRFNQWKDIYNFHRPHETLAGQYPSRLYKPSGKQYPRKIAKAHYPAHFEVRRVCASGCFSWRGNDIPSSTILIGEDLGFEPVTDDIWAVYLYWKRLGFLDERKLHIVDELNRINRRKV